MSFRKNGYQVVENVLDDKILKHLSTEFEMTKDVFFYMFNRNDKHTFGDKQSPNSFSMYSPICFEALLPNLNDIFNEISGKKLVPAASYARIYYEGAILEKHIDRNCCEYSATICIDSDCLWDFFIEDYEKNTNKILLNPGDLCFYKGCDLTHWRHPYTGKKQIQCFLHYVDSEGEYKDWIFDQRPLLGLNKKQVFLEMFRLLHQDDDITTIMSF